MEDTAILIPAERVTVENVPKSVPPEGNRQLETVLEVMRHSFALRLLEMKENGLSDEGLQVFLEPFADRYFRIADKLGLIGESDWAQNYGAGYQPGKTGF